MKKEIKKELNLGSFTRRGVQGSLGHYFSHILSDGKEVCLEACMGGYCVAIYDKEGGNLISEKTCTNIEGYELSFLPGTLFNMGTGMALEKAIEIANKKLKEELKKEL